MSYGFKPWGPLLSCKRYSGDGSTVGAIFINDVVAFSAAQPGYVTAAVAASTAITGVSLTYLAPSTTASVAVANDPDQLLQVTNDGTSGGSGVATQAMIGDTGVLIQTSTGNTNTKLSGQDLDTSTIDSANTSAEQFLLQDHVERSDNAVGADNRESIVSFTNTHTRRVATGFGA